MKRRTGRLVRTSRTRAGEYDRSPAVLHHRLRGRLADDEARSAAQPPDLLEHHGLDLQERLPVLGAGIEYDGAQTPERRDIVEQRVDLIDQAQVRRPDRRFSASFGTQP